MHWRQKGLWETRVSIGTMAGMQSEMGQGVTKKDARIVASRKYMIIYQFSIDCGKNYTISH